MGGSTWKIVSFRGRLSQKKVQLIVKKKTVSSVFQISIIRVVELLCETIKSDR